MTDKERVREAQLTENKITREADATRLTGWSIVPLNLFSPLPKEGDENNEDDSR